MLELSKNNNSLEVKKVNIAHNHVISRQIFERLPNQRKMPPEVVSEVKEAIKLKANSKLLQRKVEATTGKKVTLKDLANLKQLTKSTVSSNDLKDVVDFLKGKLGSCVEVVVGDDDSFQGVFYQDMYMKTVFEKYPEIILVDATYKLLELRLPVYVMMGIDGDGQSEIIALFILGEETKVVVKKIVEIFKKHNPNWVRTTAIMSDKDFNEREAFSGSFPQARLLICLYHTFRTFRREVTCEKMGITSEERFRCLEIIQKMAYSKTPIEFETLVETLRLTKLQSVITYFEENWENIKEQWVFAFKNEVFNLGETTNNRVESNFNKLKSVCTKHTNFIQFLTEFFSFLDVIRNERNHHHIMAISRCEIKNLVDEDLKLYHKYLTPYAFNKVQVQFELMKKLTSDFANVSAEKFSHQVNNQKLLLTTRSCSCNYMTMIGLPCTHLLKLRSCLSLALFESSLVNRRWTKELLNNTLESKSVDIDSIPSGAVELVVSQDENKFSIEPTVVLSQAQKYRKLLRTCQLLASVGSECGMTVFGTRLELLQKILEKWQKGDDVCIFEDEIIYHYESSSDKAEEIVLTIEGQHVREMKSVIPEPSETETTAVEISGSQLQLSQIEVNEVGKKDNCEGQMNLEKIKMPPKMLKRGRPKGADTTAIGLPSSKKNKNGKVIPFSKLQPKEKNKRILFWLTGDNQITTEALDGVSLLSENHVKPFNSLPDSLLDQCVDIHRVERFFDKGGWKKVLKAIKEKSKTSWACLVCSHKVKDAKHEESVLCDRCLLWCHLKCTGLKKLPKKRNWFCKVCKSKYV